MRIIILLLIISALLPMLTGCGGRIEGYVYKSTARVAVGETEALSTVKVTITSVDDPAITKDTYSQTNGSYIIEDVTAGMYNMSFELVTYGLTVNLSDSIEVRNKLTTPVSVRIPLPTSPSLTYTQSAFTVSGSSLTLYYVNSEVLVMNTGDCPIYGVVVTMRVRSSGSVLLATAVNNVENNPIGVDSDSTCYFYYVDCGKPLLPDSISTSYTVSYSTTATPTTWSIKKL